MKRGSTPTHKFVLPFAVDQVDEVEITYQQKDEEILKKYKKDCVLEDRTVSVTLTQEESFEFTEDVNVEIQVRVLTKGGEVLPSNIICVSCDRCLSDEVL